MKLFQVFHEAPVADGHGNAGVVPYIHVQGADGHSAISMLMFPTFSWAQNIFMIAKLGTAFFYVPMGLYR